MPMTPSQSFPELSTPRLRIRRFDISDIESLVAYRSKPSVAKYQGWPMPYTVDEGMRLLKEMKHRYPGMKGVWVQFAIQHLETGHTIGDCGLRVQSADPTQAEIGFTIDSRMQGRGLGSEAVERLVRYAFDELKLRRLVAVTDDRNLKSARMLHRLGFRLEGHFIQNSRDRLNTVAKKKPRWVSEFSFALLKSEWRKKK